MANGKRSKDKELRILRAAITVFGRRGYHASSISDIAEEAGVAAGTIYLYFSRKEDLLVRMFQRFIGGYIEQAEPLLADVEAGLPRLRRVIELQLRFFDRDKALARAFELHLREVNPVIREGILPTLRRYFAVIEQVVREGVEAGVFDPDLDVRLARRLLFGGLEEVTTAWALSRRDQSLLAVLDPLYRMVGRALGAREEDIDAVSLPELESVPGAPMAADDEDEAQEKSHVG